MKYIFNDAQVQVVFADSTLLRHLISALECGPEESVPVAHVVLIDVERKGQVSKTSDLEALVKCQEYEDCFSSQDNANIMFPTRTMVDLALDDDFHMYYTSGTTGHPKGVLLSHRIVLYHAIGTIQEMQLNKGDIWAHLAPMFHLVDVFAIYAITLVGGRHVTVPTFGASEALLLLERECITVANLASTMIAIMVENPLIDQLDFSSLRLLSCGGSPQSPAVIARAISVFGCEFFISYGMTECCGKISMSLLEQEDLYTKSNEELLELVCTSGRPFCLIDVRVVGDDDADVSKDDCTSGEVWVRGPTVFRGYWNSLEANAEAFTVDGWFRTGDLAVARKDGYIRVIDRKKDMLLVGGENVYTTEVEEVLHAHPDVLQAAVFGVPNPIMGELVSAAVVLRSGSQLIQDKNLINWCRENLAEYKVPASVYILDAMPTTSTGKPLKTELRKLFANPPRSNDPPSTGYNVVQNSKEIAHMLARWCCEEDSAENTLELHSTFGVNRVADRLVIPGMTYVLVMDAASELLQGIETLVNAGIRHVAVVALNPLISKDQLETIAAHKINISQIIFIHINAVAFKPGYDRIIRTALCPIRSLMPPIASVVYGTGMSSPLIGNKKPTPMKDTVLDVLRTVAGSGIAEKASEGQPLMASGVSSTLAVQLVSALEGALGTQLPGTLVFDYPTVSEMVEFLSSSKGARGISEHGDSSDGNSMPQIKNVLQVVLSAVGKSLGLQNCDQQIAAESPLMSEGLTSTMAVQLVSSLESLFHMELPPTLVFDYPTAKSIAEYIVGRGGNANDGKLARTETLVNSSLHNLPTQGQLQSSIVAIVSSDHEAPGKDSSLDALHNWDRIALVPLERWDVDADLSDNERGFNLHFGSFLDNVAVFDANLFGIAPAEALLMDPQQRLVMESFSAAVAGFVGFGERYDVQTENPIDSTRLYNNPNNMQTLPKATSIFVGVSQLDYARIAYDTGSALNTYYATGAHLSVTAGRLAYTYGLQGAAVVVDTACSSSLVTTHFAARSVRGKDCELAGSLGVNLTLVHSWTMACLRAGMLSDEGRCKTMDTSADGYVRAEAVGTVLLSAIDTLASHEGYIFGNTEQLKQIILLLGTAVNEDGRSSSLTAPNGPAQQEVIQRALQDGNLVASDVSLIEMHGTGTSLGDPIETGALVSSLLKPSSQPLTLSTAKSSIGHAEPAAGIAGTISLANSLESQYSKPFTHLRSLNPYVATALNVRNQLSIGARSSLPRQLSPLMSVSEQLCGGVSSFAFQGTNSHAVFKIDIAQTSKIAVGLTGINLSVKKMLKSSRRRYWVLPPAHALASQVSMSSKQLQKEILFSSEICSPRLAEFWEYGLDDSGFLMLPSIAVESVCAAATSSLNDMDSNHVGLTECCFNVLRSPFGPLVLTCSLQVVSGQFMVNVGSKRGMHGRNKTVATGSFSRFDLIVDPQRMRQVSLVEKMQNPKIATNLSVHVCNYNDDLAMGRVDNQGKDISNGFLLSPSCAETQSQLLAALKLTRTSVCLGIVPATLAAMCVKKASNCFQSLEMYSNNSAGDFGSLRCDSNFFAFWDGLQYKPWKELLEIGTVSSRTQLQSSRTKATSHFSLSEADMVSEVSRIVEKVIGLPILVNQPLMDAGLDSLGAVELATALSQRFGVTVHSTLVFDYPTAEAVSKHLFKELETVPAESADILDHQSTEYLHTLNVFPRYNLSVEPFSAIKIITQNASPMIGDEYAALENRSPFCGQYDRIKHVPLNRWDIDLAGTLDGDETVMPILVSLLRLLVIKCVLVGHLLQKSAL